MKKMDPKKVSRLLTAAVLTIALLITSVSVFAEEGIGAENAKNIAFADAGVTNAVRVFAEYELDDGRFVYDVDFYADGVEYEYHVLASDGTVVKKKAEYPLTGAGSVVSAQEAAQIALTDAGADAAVAAETREDLDDGRKEFKVMFIDGIFLYEYEIDAATGCIREKSVEVILAEEGASPYIGAEKAKQIALDHAGLNESAVSFFKSEQDTEKGQVIYEIEFRAAGFEYEYEIDAATGRILKTEKERD